MISQLWLLKTCDNMKSLMFRIRIDPEFKEEMRDAVKNGKAENMSDLVRRALEQFLE